MRGKSQNQNVETILTVVSPIEILAEQAPPTDHILSVYELKTQTELVRYYHAAAGFPTQPTWTKAIRNGHYKTWTGLTAAIAAKHFPESNETWHGHGRKIQSNLRSTKKLIENEIAETTNTNGETVLKETGGQNKGEGPLKGVYHVVYNLHDEMERKMYTDQTGTFPVRSYRGMQYVMVLIEMESNSTLVAAMRNRTSGEMVEAYQILVDRLKAGGITPTMHILDNECSEEYKQAIMKNHVNYQLVPPHDHQRNIAEKAIQVFKDHFVAVLCGTAVKFPMQLWCRILGQAEHQLNMLRKSRVNPERSSYQVLYGDHDYNTNPFAPLGIEVELHEMPSKRPTWGANTKKGYYIGNSWEHYRCHEIWVSETSHVRVGQTVFFKYKYLTQPSVTPLDAIVQASDDLCSVLKGRPSVKGNMRTAVELLMEIFRQVDDKEKTDVDIQRANQGHAAARRETTEQEELKGVWIEPDETELADDDLRTTRAVQITHPNKGGPTLVEDDEPMARAVRLSARRQQQLLSATEMSGSCPTARQASRRRFKLEFLTDFAGSVLDAETGELLEYRHLIKRPKYKNEWGYSFGNKIGRLAQGMPGRNDGTNTLFFINKNEVPDDRWKDVTYGNFFCNVRPQKEETNRTRLAFGGNNTVTSIDCGTPTANLLTVKLLINSIISTPGAKFLGLDLKDFYLNTPMDRPEFLRMKIDNFPDDVIEQYKLKDKADNKGFVILRVEKGMYGLPHAGILAQNFLEERLELHGYTQSDKTPGFWSHTWRPINFTLIVDNFGVKYVGEEHANHLLKVLKEHYVVDEHWEDSQKYCGITMDWDYIRREVHLSMPGYCIEALTRFRHDGSRKAMDQPHKHVVPAYGTKVQYAKEEDTLPKMGPTDKLFIQQVTGTFLYYARAVDATMLVALSAITSEQATPTEETMKKTLQFLDYAASHLDAILTYRASNMVLNVHSDASYLSEPKARSRAGGHYFLSDNAANPDDNGAVLNIAQVIKM